MVNRKFAFFITLVAVLLGPLGSLRALAQEGGESWLFLSNADAESAPTITLRAYGVNPDGTPLDLSPTNLIVTNNGLGINNLTSGGPEAVGTFTVFIIDIPPGIQEQLPAIQQTIEQFASPPNMQEGLDYIAIYRVGETAAVQLLEPTHFYNAVRNFFATPLEPEGGPTALIDSLVGLLDNINSIKPDPNLYTSLVVMTDGTDAVSTQFEGQDVASHALAAHVPIHTISLTNVNLQPGGQEAGRTYLGTVAADSRGIGAALDDPTGIGAIWQRIGLFRNHTLLQYTVEDLSAGEQQIVLGLANEPAIQVQTTVTVSAAAPSVVLNLPEENREFTLSDLETPVQLSFSASVSWLDDIQREVTNAEILVNGTPVQSIDVTQLDRFSVQISDFTFGQNTVQIAITDNQGKRATSPAISLTVNEEVTNESEGSPSTGGASTILRYVIGCFVVLVLLVVLALLAVATRRWRLLQRLGLASALRRIPFLRPYLQDAAEVQRYGRKAEQYQKEFERYAPDNEQEEWGQPQEYAPQQNWPEANTWDQPEQGGEPWSPVQQPPMRQSDAPYLEILESVTRMPPTIDLTAVEHRIGRSPAQADIVFENDITVSRLHASIVLENNAYRIYDEGSTSGTWVNEQPVSNQGQTLNDGDEIRLGAAVLRYRM
ncbi:MAG: FHA domain-containing protein [Candidatus Promineifilaceae bacterium]